PSTTSVYGTQSELVDEGCLEAELKPQSPYAESKLAAERLLRSLGEREGLRFISCRLGTIFGVSPGMRFHTAINKFCWQAVMRQPLTVWKTAIDQRRPYLELADAVRAIHFIVDREIFDGGTYNVITTNCTVREIVDRIKEHVSDLAIEYVDSAIMNQLS